MKNVKLILLLLLLQLFANEICFAQRDKTYTVTFNDSLTAEQNNNFLYCNATFKNLLPYPQYLKLHLLPPAGWKLVNGNTADICLEKNDSFLIAFTIAKKQKNIAGWQQLQVQVSSGDVTDSLAIHVNAEELSNFSVTPGTIIFTKAPRTFETSILLKNTGNVTGNYIIKLVDEKTALNITAKVKLEAGSDSLYKVVYTVPKQAWNKFIDSKIRLEITDASFVKKVKKDFARVLFQTSSSNNSSLFVTNMDLVRKDSVFEKYSSAYPLVKTDIETGYLRNNNQASYFFAARGELPLTDNSSLSVSYRSRQYGVYNIIDKDVVDIIYRDKKFFIHAGKISDSKYFYSYGNGLSIGYNWKGYNRITLSGVIHTPGFFSPSDTYGMNLIYRVKKLFFTHDLVYNKDFDLQRNNYLVNNEINYKKNKALDMAASIGMARSASFVKTGAPVTGQSFGYNFNYRKKKIAINSQSKFFDKTYPGVERGRISAVANLRFKFKKSSVETFYHYDKRASNYFRDSLYNTSLLSYNIQQYGVRYNQQVGKATLTLGSGMIVQNGGSGNNFLGPQYKFGEIQFYYKSKKSFLFSLNSTTSFAAVSGRTTYFSISSFNTAYKFFGLNGGFSNVPVFLSEGPAKTKIFNGNQQTINGGPYISAVLFKKISFGSQFSFSKTLYDNNINRFAGININYNNSQAGIQLAVNGYVPLQAVQYASANPLKNGYFNVSFKKKLTMPFVLKRKYYTIHAKLYEDDNGNNIYDKGEKPVIAASLGINDVHFITDKNGSILYRNIEKGNYAIDLAASNVYGYMPATVTGQSVMLKKNMVVEIPFKKSKTISGKVAIDHDSNNKVNYMPVNIKVIARDSSGKEYYTTTNKEGAYYFTLPAGIYTVELGAQSANEVWKLQKRSFTVNLNTGGDAVCNFLISQKQREIKMLNTKKEVIVPVMENKKKKEAKNEKH